MILTCPECATSYFVDDSRIATTGRTVKCSNCGARWTALPEGAEATPPAPARLTPPPVSPPPPPPPVDELVIDGPEPAAPFIAPKRPAAPKREANGKVMVWAISAGAAALLIAGAIVYRGQVVRMVPASQAAYAGLGLPVSSLVIENVRADPGFQGGRAVLSVTGQIRNQAEKAVSVPPVRVTLLDRLGKPVATKVAQPIDRTEPAKAVRYFAITMVDPPASLHDLEVAFEMPKKGAPAPVKAAVSPPGPAAPPAAGGMPAPIDAKPLPPGSPDALPPTPR